MTVALNSTVKSGGRHDDADGSRATQWSTCAVEGASEAAGRSAFAMER